MLEHGLRSSSCLDATLRTLHPSHLSSRLPRGQLCQLSALLRPTLSYQLAGKDLLTKMVCGYMTKSLVSMAPGSAQSLTDMWDCSQMDWQDGTFTSKREVLELSAPCPRSCALKARRGCSPSGMPVMIRHTRPLSSRVPAWDFLLPNHCSRKIQPTRAGISTAPKASCVR